MTHYDRATQLVGEFIDEGRFLLIEILGEGASGIVYRALDTASDPIHPHYVAIKWMRKPSSRSPGYDRRISRICDEIDFHKRSLGHPNVLPFHRVIEDGKSIFMVLQLAQADLYTNIHVSKSYHGRNDLIKSVFLQLIDGLQHCHDRGVYHRDLKPENIVCSNDSSRVYIADFGLATVKKYADDDFGCGTVPYMSPECLADGVSLPTYATPASDVWALGVILVNLITGRSPWRCASASDPTFKTYLHRPDFFKRVLPVAEEVEPIIYSILAVNPYRRTTLPQLRQQIVRCQAFCLSGEELERARPHIRLMAEYYSAHIPSVLLAASEISDWSDQSGEDPTSLVHSSLTSSLNSYVFDSPSSSWSETMQPPGLSRQLSTGNNSDDSEGPFTPETHAFESVVDVPDFSLTMAQGQARPGKSLASGASDA